MVVTDRFNDVTWVSWRFKSSAIQLIVQQFIQSNNNENIDVPYDWPFVWGIHRTGGFPSQRASAAERVYILCDVSIKSHIKFTNQTYVYKEVFNWYPSETLKMFLERTMQHFYRYFYWAHYFLRLGMQRYHIISNIYHFQRSHIECCCTVSFW